MPSRRAVIYKVYPAVYWWLAGRGLRLRPWHVQWLTAAALYEETTKQLRPVRGRLLDVGCGDKPYASAVDTSVEYVGIDICAGPHVDVVFDGVHIPFGDASFDAILCTQVMEHAEQPDQLRDEMMRCLKPGGLLVLSVPFIYNQHGAPFDFRRFTRYGIARFFDGRVERVEVLPIGGIGTSLGTLLLNWYESQTTYNRWAYLFKLLTLPLFLVATLVINGACSVLNQLDRTGEFYSNLVMVGYRAPVPREQDVLDAETDDARERSAIPVAGASNA